MCESAYCSIGQKKLVNRGFLNGPFCPIYGFGALLVISILSPFVNNIPVLFIASIIVTSTLEYITSYVLEKIFHMSWWDYSTYKYNINGRVCLQNSLMFGLLSLFVMLVIHPAIDDFVASINTKVAFALSVLFATYFIVDTIITAGTILHLNERLEKLHELHEDLLEKRKRHLEVVKGHLQASLANQIEELGLSKYSPAEMEELLSNDFKGNFIKEEHKIMNELEFEIKSLNTRIEELKSKGHGVLRRRVIKAFPNMKSLKHKSLLEEIKENINNK
ncbi:putative ABC transporter permease [Peptacetobacter sp. AB845]|uniref:putative ABC transporter permease n=1 Tax=Peptacetobacter sp. AB845 TaxID=3388429 RepID=UPI0039C913BC